MKLEVLLLVLSAPSILAGKILFFMPVMPKSSTFTFLPLVHELVERGHEVTVVNPVGTKKEHPNLTQIKPKSIHLQARMKEQLKTVMHENVTKFDTFKMVANAVNSFLKEWPDLFKELETDYDFYNKDKYQFDMVICYAMLTNELGYFMAHHFNAQLVLYSTAQSSMDFLDELVGQPNNPAILPMIGTSFM